MPAGSLHAVIYIEPEISSYLGECVLPSVDGVLGSLASRAVALTQWSPSVNISSLAAHSWIQLGQFIWVYIQQKEWWYS